jgi:hypothetical protein
MSRPDDLLQPGRVGCEHEYQGRLAQPWKLRDERTHVFHLRRGAKFHNNRAVEAEDVKYSLERIMDPATHSLYATTFDVVDRIDTPNKYTVIVRFKKPFAPLLAKLADPPIANRAEGGPGGKEGRPSIIRGRIWSLQAGRICAGRPRPARQERGIRAPFRAQFIALGCNHRALRCCAPWRSSISRCRFEYSTLDHRVGESTNLRGWCTDDENGKGHANPT